MFEVTVKLGDRLVTKFRGQGEMTIVRDPSCELMLDNLGVSRRHAQLREVGDLTLTLQDGAASYLLG